MKKIKQNHHLNIAMIVLIALSVLMFILCITLCFVHLHWTNNGIQISGYYKNDNITYFSATNKEYLTVEAPYKSALLEGKKVLVYYDANNPQSCYIYDQIKLGLALGIISFVFILGALAINIFNRKIHSKFYTITSEGKTVICDISDIEVTESNSKEYIILHAKYIDPETNKEYEFESNKIKDQELINNPDATGTLQVSFLEDEPEQYVVTAYQINEK